MMINKRFLSVAMGAIILSVASAARATIVFSSSFETPVISGGYQNFIAGSFTEGWTIPAGYDVDLILDPNYSPTPFPDGKQAVDLNGYNQGEIYQSIPTVIGRPYVLSFWLSQNGGGGALTGVTAGPASGIFPSDSSGWVNYTLPFVATSTSSLIDFASVVPPGASGPTLDMVTVSTAVPLPASAGIGFSMLAGFGILFAARKRLSRRPRIV